MDTFAQKFTTPWISGGVKIKIKMSNSEIKLMWQLRNAIDSGTISNSSNTSITDYTKYWVLNQWIGYYIGFAEGDHSGITREILTSDIHSLTWDSGESLIPPPEGRYGIFTTPSDLYSEMEDVNYGDGVIPITLKLELFSWLDAYGSTINSIPLVIDYVTLASEDIENSECWIYLFWEPLPIGNYLWKITPINGDDTSSFKVLYDPDSIKFQSWKNTSLLGGDYYSEVMKLDSESYENVMSISDSFSDGFIANDGTNDIKVNKNFSYYNAIKTRNIAITASGLKGRIATGSRVKIKT